MPDKIVNGAFTLHHLGIAVPDLQQASAFYSQVLGLEAFSGPFEDPIQKVRISFLAEPGRQTPSLELICPLNEESPVNGYLKKSVGAYHLCYQTPDISRALAHLRKNGCLIVSPPVPAVAFGGQKIAWCYTPTQHLLELLEIA